MERIGGIVKKSAGRDENKRLHSPMHALADEISSFFGERKLFGMYLGIIKRVGVDRARAIFAGIKSENNIDNPRKLFMWQTSKGAGEKPGTLPKSEN